MTEADPVALLGLGLGALGHCVRVGVRLQGGQPANLSMILVGDERAGADIAWGYVDRLFSKDSVNWKESLQARILPLPQNWRAWAEWWNCGKGSFLSWGRPKEVLDRLTNPEAIYSGLAPRTLLLRVQGGTPQPLDEPEGVNLNAAFELDLKGSLAFGRRLIPSRLRIAPQITELWKEIYGELRAPRHAGSMVNVMTELAERHVPRLAGLYAVVDQSIEIKQEHLFAALAVWDHSEGTLYELFANQVGDKKQDAVLRNLQERHPAGMTTFEVNRTVLQGNFRGGAGPLLRQLEDEGLIYSREEPASGHGRRPTHRWFPTQEALDGGVRRSYLGIAKGILRQGVVPAKSA